ncbi:hypothetical protein AB3Y40_13030 [Yoonia sp. R2331]|uniref:hypothetical protein n=1 Tax=Yoonia sp. R2331 TaxID=3237238 RepID=UPI0034E4092C
MRTGFFWDEGCLWHAGGHYAGMLPVGGMVQLLDGGVTCVIARQQLPVACLILEPSHAST